MPLPAYGSQSHGRTPAVSGSENLGPVVLKAHDGPAGGPGTFERVVGAVGVVELTVGIVVEQ